MLLVADYYERHAATLRSPDTARHHAARIGQWLEGKRASDTRAVVKRIKDDLAGHYKPATINRSLGAISKALADAWERGDTAVDYSSLVKRLPENNARKTHLSIEEVEKLAAAASFNVRVAIWCSLYTGCRRGEILAVRSEDIGADTIRVPAGNTKTLKYREVEIVPALRPWLEHLPLPINFEGLKTGFGRAREKAGMPEVTFHDLRRSCGTILLRAGAPMHIVSQILGHSSVRVTEKHYAFLDAGAKAKALHAAFGPTGDAHRPAGSGKRRSA